jgi:hypothetical protein
MTAPTPTPTTPIPQPLQRHGREGGHPRLFRATHQVKKRSSFLKKRTKKLLLLGALAPPSPQPAGQNFFATFCSQKVVLSYFLSALS